MWPGGACVAAIVIDISTDISTYKVEDLLIFFASHNSPPVSMCSPILLILHILVSL